MLVRMNCSLVWFGRACHDGDEIDLPSDVAAKYIAAGSAEPVHAIEAEQATALVPETAAVNYRKTRHGRHTSGR